MIQFILSRPADNVRCRIARNSHKLFKDCKYNIHLSLTKSFQKRTMYAVLGIATAQLYEVTSYSFTREFLLLPELLCHSQLSFSILYNCTHSGSSYKLSILYTNTTASLMRFYVYGYSKIKSGGRPDLGSIYTKQIHDFDVVYSPRHIRKYHILRPTAWELCIPSYR